MDNDAIRVSNRRLGHRVQPDRLDILWCLPGTVVGHRKERKRPPTARVVDMSFTGMQVEAPTHKDLVRGAVMEVVIDEVRTPVRIRWIRASDQPGMALFGIELLRQTPELTRVVTSIIESCDVRDGIELREPPKSRMTYW